MSGGVQPVELVVGATTYMYLGSFLAPDGKVLASTDGVTFTPVPATLNGAPLVGTWFSFVNVPGGDFRMYYDLGSASLFSATSSDGLNWTGDPGTRIELNPIAVAKVVALSGGGYRVYYTTSGGPTGIASATSTDGLTFTPDAGLRLAPAPHTYSWGDPNVAVTGTTYLMSSTQIPADNSHSNIWLSSSSDGLTWTTSANPIITSTKGSPVDSSFVPFSNGAFRVYYGLFINSSAVPAGNVQSEILSGVPTPSAM